MRICVDIQAAIAQRAGVGRYTKLLVEHLGADRGADELSLFYFDFQRKGLPFPVIGARQKSCRWIPGRVVQSAWRHARFPPYNWFAGRADLYHFPNFIRPPLSRGRSVVTIHDLSFVRFPETLEERNLRYLTSCIRATVERTDAIITDSVAVADELTEHFAVPRDRIFPIHLGLNEHSRRPNPDSVRNMRKRLNLDRPYILSVGTLEPRKNHAFLIEVFDRMKSFDGDLVIAGMRGWKFEPILERMLASPKADRIHYLEYVEESDLDALYAGAELFVFPSIYEGFGFTPLEAMACGTPVLSSAGGSLPEVLGEAAVVLPHYDAEAWATAADGLTTDDRRRKELSDKGFKHAAQFSWRETARKTWEVYRKVGGA